MSNVIMVKAKVGDEARWQCESCGKELAYSQPANFGMALDLVKVFADFHDQCPKSKPSKK